MWRIFLAVMTLTLSATAFYYAIFEADYTKSTWYLLTAFFNYQLFKDTDQ